MFSLCESMKWAHLPEPGGLYDQDPYLLDGFRVLFSERSAWEAEQEEKRKREEDSAQRKNRGAQSRVAGRRR